MTSAGILARILARTLLAVALSSLASLSAQGAVQGASPAAEPPFPHFGLTFDYVPARDGLALLSGGPGQDGYAASARASKAGRLWEPRFSTETRAKGTDNIYNGEFQFYPDPEYHWSNGFTPFSIVDGSLRIRAERTADAHFASGEIPNDPATGQPYPWVSGILVSRQSFSQHGGYFEIDAKVPKGAGTWPAFWLIPVDEQHPPEIDIVEYRGQLPNEYHVAVLSPPKYNDEASYPANQDLSGDYHKYAILWTDDKIEFYFDRRLVLTKDISLKPEFAQAFYMVVNLAMGSRGLKDFVAAPDGSTPSPSDLMVRSVTVWQHEGPTGIQASSTSVPEDVPAGTVIANLSITKFGDVAGEQFSIADDQDEMFQVDGSKLRSRARFDFARKQSHLVVVKVTDSQGRTWRQPLDINVLDAGRGRNLYRGGSDGSATAPGKPAGDRAANNAWLKQNVAVLDNLPDADGNRSAEFIREKPTSSRAEFSISRLANTAATVPARYIVRGDFKPLGRHWIEAEIATADKANKLRVYFNLETGELGSYYLSWSKDSQPRFILNARPVIAPVGNGFYRCQIDFTSMMAGALRTTWKIAASGDEPSGGHVGDPTFVNGTARRGRGILSRMSLRMLAPETDIQPAASSR